MSDEEQQVAIAEACGWEYLPGDEPTYGGNYKQAIWYHPDKGSHKTDWRKKGTYGLPDYLSDLNAMHEAEKVMTDKQKTMYVFLLVPKEHLHPEPSPTGMFITLHRTARQRAEAFLRTLGKWRES